MARDKRDNRDIVPNKDGTGFEFVTPEKHIAVVNEEFGLEAIEDIVIVLEDNYRSGLECTVCGGKRHEGVKCKHCKGTGFHKGKEENGLCPDCEVIHEKGRESLGYVPCSQCNGKGGTIIAPENSQRRPTTGKILSAGVGCNELHANDRVGYTNHSGHVYEFGRKKEVVIRVLREREILFRIHGVAGVDHVENAELKGVGLSE